MLKLKKIPITHHCENVAYIHHACPALQLSDQTPVTRIEIHGAEKPFFATALLTSSEEVLKPDEIGVSEPGFSSLGLKEGAIVTLSLAPAPSSIESVRRKINGGVLSSSEYRSIISDISSYRYTKPEVAALLVANASFMTPQEVLSITEAMVEENYSIKWDQPMAVDEHCIGGVPANRTSMIVAPIVIAYGMCMPKTSTRSITSCSSDADAMETLTGVNFSEKELSNIVDEVGGCLVWIGGRLSLAPADDIIMGTERMLGISTPQQIVASILAQKVSMGVTHLVVDIPVGASAKVRTMSEAMHLRKLFEYVGDMLAIVIDVVVTDGGEPIGNGIGPVLEARDVMRVLRCKPEAPQDLREKALFLAGRVLEFDPKLPGGKGYAKAQEILDSGRALEVMSRMIHAQGRVPPPVLGQLVKDICSPAAGLVEAIDSGQLMKIAMIAGSPRDKGAGIDLLKKVGDGVQAGEPLYRIHAAKQADFAFATGMAEGYSGYQVSSKTVPPTFR